MADICKAPEQWSVGSLPNELLLSITSYACTSQSSYRTLILINKRFHDLVQPDHLPQVPIRLNLSSVRPFMILLWKMVSLGVYDTSGSMVHPRYVRRLRLRAQPDRVGLFEGHPLFHLRASVHHKFICSFKASRAHGFRSMQLEFLEVSPPWRCTMSPNHPPPITR